MTTARDLISRNRSGSLLIASSVVTVRLGNSTLRPLRVRDRTILGFVDTEYDEFVIAVYRIKGGNVEIIRHTSRSPILH